MIQLTAQQTKAFQAIVLDYYQKHARQHLPWRMLESGGDPDPYAVLVSEIMLQQTQVQRVATKFLEFIEVFPTVQSLAQASLSDVLRAWSGLGYNRRAKFLHQAAQMIVDTFEGTIPRELSELEQLPGVGKNTAAAIRVYSFNQPAVFIETNIRAVFLHHFFPHQEAIVDGELLPLIAATLESSSPRQWYWALMDYGSYLKSSLPNPSRRSKHHVIQSTFKGSKRQVRGAVLKLLQNQNLSQAELDTIIGDERLNEVLRDLVSEQLITERSKVFSLG